MRNLWVLLYIAFVVALIVGMWKMFEKAGEKGWKSLIPLYNTWLYFRIAGRNGWGMLLLFIPFVGFVVLAVVAMDMAKHFGKSSAYGFFALFLFAFWGVLELGFGDAEYLGPKHA